MELRNLITFIHVAELGSFTKAAEQLGYSQSTISFQIKQLEEELGCLLFERINHTVTLTQRGHELVTYAHQVRSLTDEFKEMPSDDYVYDFYSTMALQYMQFYSGVVGEDADNRLLGERRLTETFPDFDSGAEFNDADDYSVYDSEYKKTVTVSSLAERSEFFAIFALLHRVIKSIIFSYRKSKV